MILDILKYPDKRLRTIAKPVVSVDETIRQQVKDMFETMYEAPGIGLAATQVNFHQRIIVIDISDQCNEPICLINPKVIEKSGEIQWEEGCLSVPDYYENGDTAIRMERKLIKKVKRPAHTPYHRQSTDFTCGPSALIMAMKSQNKSISASKAQELNIWREATTIFMASGHGGTSPLGLAIAASHRGFWTELWVSGEKIPFIKTMRTEAKKEIYQIIF